MVINPSNARILAATRADNSRVRIGNGEANLNLKLPLRLGRMTSGRIAMASGHCCGWAVLRRLACGPLRSHGAGNCVAGGV